MMTPQPFEGRQGSPIGALLDKTFTSDQISTAKESSYGSD
jgi:hypothetical protein